LLKAQLLHKPMQWSCAMTHEQSQRTAKASALDCANYFGLHQYSCK